jgi:hypothetical protein
MAELIVVKRNGSDDIKFFPGSTAKEVLDALHQREGLRGCLVHQDGCQVVDSNV